MESTVEGIRKGLDRLMANLPTLVDDFRPYLDTAIFSSGNYANIRLYNTAAAAIFDEMEILFEDIIYQLSSQHAGAIESAVEVSKGVHSNIRLLNNQVSRGTL
ncbi:hypothetical protein WMZ97_17810 [Lentibacillus sp. N15]|uniref:hypothetical protein n=1 Tax=Lentibacillus songyuanensis TaxID=3136161 RepID=UPI0031BAA3C3